MHRTLPGGTADSKKTSNDMQAKLEGIQEELRMDSTPEELQEARKLLGKMRAELYKHYNGTKEIYDELKIVTDEKTMIDNVLSGKEKPNFGEVTGEDFLSANTLEYFANRQLTAKEQAVAYSMYGNDYLQARSDKLQQNVDEIREKTDNLNRTTMGEMSAIKKEWDSKFGRFGKLNEIMEKTMLGEARFVDPNSPDLLNNLKNSLVILELYIEKSHNLMKEFNTAYFDSISEKIYA